MQPIIACVCFVTRDRDVLLLKRNHPPFLGLYDGLGGSIEPGEPPADAARREVREESGLEVDPLYRGHLMLYGDVSSSVISAHVFVGESSGGEVRASEEGLPEWVPLIQVARLTLLGFVRTTLPLVMVRDTFLSGTIWHDEAGNPRKYSLEHWALAATKTYRMGA